MVPSGHGKSPLSSLYPRIQPLLYLLVSVKCYPITHFSHQNCTKLCRKPLWNRGPISPGRFVSPFLIVTPNILPLSKFLRCWEHQIRLSYLFKYSKGRASHYLSLRLEVIIDSSLSHTTARIGRKLSSPVILRQKMPNLRSLIGSKFVNQPWVPKPRPRWRSR